MKINWTTRLKNGTTLTALVGAILLFAKQVTDSLMAQEYKKPNKE